MAGEADKDPIAAPKGDRNPTPVRPARAIKKALVRILHGGAGGQQTFEKNDPIPPAALKEMIESGLREGEHFGPIFVALTE